MRSGDERRGIFGEARAAVTRTWMQELVADAPVEAHPEGDLPDFGARLLAQVRDLTHVRDFGREESVRRIFDQLRGAPVGEHNRHALLPERPIERARTLRERSSS